MKKIILLILSLFYFSVISGQSKAEFGAFIGTSYYQGDINKSQLFYSPSFATAVIVKYNFSHFLAASIVGKYGKLSGADSDFNNPENLQRDAGFSTSIFDISLQFEFNFLSYTSSGYIKKNDERFTPFVALGIGANFIPGSNNFENPITIPFGLGIKYNIFERLTLGVEWNYTKTFNDGIDGVVNAQDVSNTPLIHNQDWYSFFGCFVTYKLFRDKIDCPTYL